MNVVGTIPGLRCCQIKSNSNAIATPRHRTRSGPCIWKLQVLKTDRGRMILGTVLRQGLKPLDTDGTWWDVLVKTLRTYFVKSYKGRIIMRVGQTEHELRTDKRGAFEIDLAPGDNAVPTFEVAANRQAIPVVHRYPVRFDYSTAATIVISDIDDTILVSHSSRFLSKLWLMLFRQTAKRNFVEETERAYRALHAAGLPFVYVSASETNLFSILSNFLTYHGLPLGGMFLRPYQHWRDVLGRKVRRDYKLERIRRVITALDGAQFVLFGDDSQHDPEVFDMVCREFPHRIRDVFIRKTGFSKGKSIRRPTPAQSRNCFAPHRYSKYSEIEPQINQLIHEAADRT